ncbi:hypothetical protein ACYCVF_32045 [Bradyrhizobium sp. 1.29L]
MAVAVVRLERGALYLGPETYDRYFARLDTVILLRRDNELCILPVRHAAAGGYLLKLRNRHGDRVVQAPDFFRAHGIAENIVRQLPASWSTAQGALIAADAFNVN